METPSHDRVRSLFQMLFEMATGNLAFRLPLPQHNDELDALADMLNKVAAEMRHAVSESHNVLPHFTYQTLIQNTFILDSRFVIEGLSANASDLLGYRPEMLFRIPFGDILSIQSIDLWKDIMAAAAEDDAYHETVQIIFVSASRQILPAFCTVSRLLFSDKIFVSTVTTVLLNDVTDRFTIPPGSNPRPAHPHLIQEVHDYIVSHLDDPLPTVKQLSKIFGTNELKIKDGFRHFFNTSVYQFYNEKRLQKAHLLIQQSGASLKSIAFSCGYNDYTNFYKSFKKRFGYAPSDLLRNI